MPQLNVHLATHPKITMQRYSEQASESVKLLPGEVKQTLKEDKLKSTAYFAQIS